MSTAELPIVEDPLNAATPPAGFPVAPGTPSITVFDREWNPQAFPIGYELAVETAAAAEVTA